MKDLLNSFIAQKNPTCIIDCTDIGTDLRLLEVRYMVGEHVYRVVSYHTNTWICKNPIDILEDLNISVRPEKLEDIATVECLGSFTESQRIPRYSMTMINYIDSSVQSLAIAYAKTRFETYATLIKDVRFYYSPTPTISVRFQDKGTLYGCIAINRDGIELISDFDPIMSEIISGRKAISNGGLKTLNFGK